MRTLLSNMSVMQNVWQYKVFMTKFQRLGPEINPRASPRKKNKISKSDFTI